MHVLEKRPAEASAQPLRDAIIRESQNKVIARLEERPELAISTIATSGRIEDGLACHVQQGKFTTVTDLGRGMGGDAAGPSPGFLARAAIVGCVGMAVKMLAARRVRICPPRSPWPRTGGPNSSVSRNWWPASVTTCGTNTAIRW